MLAAVNPRRAKTVRAASRRASSLWRGRRLTGVDTHLILLMGKVRCMTTLPLNVLDELYLHLDREQEPFSVQLEVGVEGRVEEERLAAAIEEAARRHPLA